MTSVGRYSVIIVICTAVMWSSSAFGKIFLEEDTLRGVKEFGIMINEIPDAFQKAGLTKEKLRTDIALKLRLAGIKVLPTVEMGLINWKSEDRAVSFAPHLDVYIFGDKVTELRGTYFYSVQVSFTQMALIQREPSISLPLPSWRALPVIGFGKDIEYIRQVVKDQVDEFLNAYLSANPKHPEKVTK